MFIECVDNQFVNFHNVDYMEISKTDESYEVIGFFGDNYNVRISKGTLDECKAAIKEINKRTIDEHQRKIISSLDELITICRDINTEAGYTRRKERAEELMKIKGPNDDLINGKDSDYIDRWANDAKNVEFALEVLEYIKTGKHEGKVITEADLI